MTFPAQQFRQMASDETRSTGDEDIAHVRAPPDSERIGQEKQRRHSAVILHRLPGTKSSLPRL